jgi:hypothetical protein
LTLLLVFGFKTYEVYQNSAAVADMVVQKFKTPDLRVDYEVSEFTGADIAIGNTGQGDHFGLRIDISLGLQEVS